MRRLKRLGQRALVAILGLVTVWLILVLFYDVADRRLPLVLALASTYAAAAYLILPRAIRLGARILNRGRVPSYTLTGDGLPGDPVNVALIGTCDELRRAFVQAGWTQADPLGIRTSWRMACAFVLNRSYPGAPFSTLYLFDRGQDVGFQQPIGDSPRRRHHVRFWGISIERAEETVDTVAFWLASRRPADSERSLWIGAATKDVGFSLTRLSFQITHATDADTIAERAFLVRELTEHGRIGPVRYHLPGERLSIGTVNRYVSDGLVAVAELSQGPADPLRPDGSALSDVPVKSD
ncbi:LssY C-terminal domain-containing protein [Methylobacterium nigriterrae]|uniref:LssY C-terminal domain-containing protein n=1 Tax=Methylobacterium nigriterrae TaxID=3127512 RepID=UPI0030133298